jgi:hypothetical protein
MRPVPEPIGGRSDNREHLKPNCRLKCVQIWGDERFEFESHVGQGGSKERLT